MQGPPLFSIFVHFSQFFEREQLNDKRKLTQYEYDLDDDVAVHGRPVGVDEAGIVGHDDGDVERRDEQQPVPACLEDAVVAQYELGLFQRRRLVLGQRRRCRVQQCLQQVPAREPPLLQGPSNGSLFVVARVDLLLFSSGLRRFIGYIERY